MRLSFLAASVFFVANVGAVQAADPQPLKVLYLTGGGWHAYAKQAPLMVKALKEHANAEVDVKADANAREGKEVYSPTVDDPEFRAVLRDPKLGQGYDAVIYNFCYGAEADKELCENLMRVTREGKPTVMLHCAMHTFRETPQATAWCECCGERSKRHDPFCAFGVKKAEPEHPVVKSFPAGWKTAGDELYNEDELFPNTQILLKARSVESNRDHAVCWVHEYGKGKVFATTLGHDLNTIEQPEYQRLIAYGTLWACGKLGEDGEPVAGYKGKTEEKVESSK